MICSACGYENQVGNRFCGMCGTPLPHRPLTAPGAHATHTFTRMPLESAKRGPELVGAPKDEANAPAPPSSGGVLIEMPSAELPMAARNSVPPSPDMVPEIPLDEYVKNFRYVPPADPGEITMRGDAEVLRADAPTVSDAPVAVPREVTSAADANPISTTEDVDERLGLGEATPDDERRDRPRFLDFNEPALPPEKPEVPVPAKVGPSFFVVGDTPLKAASPLEETDVGQPLGQSAWTWVAVAALLGFVLLGVLEWRSQVNQTNNGPVEVITMKLRNVWHRSSPAPQAASSEEADAARPAAQVEEQPNPQPQDQSLAANSNAPSSTMASNPPAPDTNPATNAASLPQSTSTVTETQPPAEKKIVSPAPSSFVDAAHSTASQKAAQPKAAPPPNSSKAVTASEEMHAVQTSAAKPKPKVQAGQEGDLDTPAQKLAPGQEELAKANDASDAAAAAAWLWKATAKGNPDAPVRLADMYVKGDGVPRSCEQALVLLQAAAANGNTQARARLAQINSSSACAQRNR